MLALADATSPRPFGKVPYFWRRGTTSLHFASDREPTDCLDLHSKCQTPLARGGSEVLYTKALLCLPTRNPESSWDERLLTGSLGDGLNCNSSGQVEVYHFFLLLRTHKSWVFPFLHSFALCSRAKSQKKLPYLPATHRAPFVKPDIASPGQFVYFLLLLERFFLIIS